MTQIQQPVWLRIMGKVFIGLLILWALAWILLSINFFERFIPSDFPANLKFIWLGLFAMTFAPTPFLIYYTYTAIYTVLSFNETTITLRHPFKTLSQPWSSIKKAYFSRGFLAIQISDKFLGTWSIRINSTTQPLLQQFKTHLPDGVWLDEDKVTRYVFRKVLPIILIAGLLMLGLTKLIENTILPYLDRRTQEFFDKK